MSVAFSSNAPIGVAAGPHDVVDEGLRIGDRAARGVDEVALDVGPSPGEPGRRLGPEVRDVEALVPFRP